MMIILTENVLGNFAYLDLTKNSFAKRFIKDKVLHRSIKNGPAYIDKNIYRMDKFYYENNVRIYDAEREAQQS